MIDFTRRRFLFGLAAVPLVVPVVKHFVLPKLEVPEVGIIRLRTAGACTDYGTLSDAAVLKFRKEARDRLAFWLSDKLDRQMRATMFGLVEPVLRDDAPQGRES